MERELILYWLLIIIGASAIHLFIRKINGFPNVFHIYILVGLILQGFLIFDTLTAKQINFHELYVETFITLVTIFMI